MRAIIGLVITIGLLSAALPASVAAAKPVNETQVRTFVRCEVQTDAGTARFYVETDDFGAFGVVAVWAPGADPEIDPPALFNTWGDVSLDGSALRGTFDLVHAEDMTPAGSATLEALLTPDGPEYDSESSEEWDGNRLSRIEETNQPFSLTGTLTLDLDTDAVGQIDPEVCGANTSTITFFVTDPNAWLYGGDQVYVSCEWTTDFGPVTLLAIDQGGNSQSELVIFTSDGVLVGSAFPHFSATAYQASFNLVNLATKQTVGSAEANAVFSPSGERITEVWWDGNHRLSEIGDALAADGTLTLTLGEAITTLTMDDVACDAGDVRVQVQEKMGKS